MNVDLFDLPVAHAEIALRWVTTLMHFLWQGAIVGGIVFTAERMFRMSANTRYTLYSAALLCLPVLVAVTFFSIEVPPSRHVATIEASSKNVADKLVHGDAGLGERQEHANEAARLHVGRSIGESRLEVSIAAGGSKRHLSRLDAGNSGETTFSSAAPFIAAAYAIGAFCLLLRLAVAVWGGNLLRSQAKPIEDGQLLELIGKQSTKLGLRVMPLVAYCERVAVPMVIGIVRPVVLLPGTLVTGLDSTQLAAVISHELAHIRRFDLAMNLAQRLLESLLFFHPVVWMISRRLSSERESCCDDLVLSLGTKRMEYVAALLRMAELSVSSRFSRKAISALAASGTDQSEFERRIQRLLTTERPSRLRLTRGGLAMLAILLTSAAVAASALASRQATSDAISQISPPLTDTVYRVATEIEPDERTQTANSRPLDPNQRTSPIETSAPGNQDNDADATDDAAANLAQAVAAINREVENLPFDVDAKSLTVEDVVGAIQRLLDDRDQKTVEGANDFPSNNDLSVSEAADLQRIATGQRLPANAQLRHFVRYDTGKGMQHGSWVRLMLKRKDAGPLSIAIRAHSEFERPYTQKERRFREVVGPHGMVGMNRLVTYFDKDPKFGEITALTADYNKLVEMANRAIVQKDVEGFMNLFHWESTAKDESLRPFVKREIENLIKQESIRLSFSRKRFSGNLRQWQVFRTFEPNLPVEGFVDIKLDDREAPQTLQWEVGSSEGEPRFVCHVIAEDDWDQWIGKEMTGKLQFSGFIVALPEGALELGTILLAPDEMAPLREANREIWRRPMPNQQVDRPKVSRNVGDDTSNAIHSIATTLQDGANSDVQRLKPLLDRWAKQKKGPFGSPKLHTADDDGNITELRLGRLELQQGDLAVIGTLRFLQELNLNNTNVTDEQMSNLAGLVNLVDLNLFDTELSGDAMKHLRTLKNLERLDVGRTKITDDGLVTLKELPKLRYLCLHDTRISDEAGKTLSQLQGLSTLKLGDTKVSGATLRDVKKLKNLSGLAINMTQVTPDELNAFAEDSRFSWMKSHQATLDEYIRRIEAGDFDRVAAMHTVVGLAIPARGSYEMTKVIAQPANQKDLKLNRKRYRIEFKWKTDEFEEGFYALVGIERGTVICHSMGIVKSKDTRESKK